MSFSPGRTNPRRRDATGQPTETCAFYDPLSVQFRSCRPISRAFVANVPAIIIIYYGPPLLYSYLLGPIGLRSVQRMCSSARRPWTRQESRPIRLHWTSISWLGVLTRASSECQALYCHGVAGSRLFRISFSSVRW